MLQTRRTARNSPGPGPIGAGDKLAADGGGLVPKERRRHVCSIYAFARTADDFADEGDLPAPERLTLLDGYRQELRRLEAGEVFGDLEDRHRARAIVVGAVVHGVDARRGAVGLLADVGEDAVHLRIVGRRQLRIRRVRALLVWTDAPEVVELSPETLDSTLARAPIT